MSGSRRRASPLPSRIRPWSTMAMIAAQAGVPRLVPPTTSHEPWPPIERGLVDANTGVGVAVERDVGRASFAGSLHRSLITGLSLVSG